MNTYVLQPTSLMLVAVLTDESLASCIAARGLSLEQARKCFLEVETRHFELSQDDFEISSFANLDIPDILLWSWIHIFSERALDLLIQMGAAKDDFVECTLGHESKPGFMHIPKLSYDVLDFDKSQFQVKIPTDPAFYHYLVKAAWSTDLQAYSLPPAFRVPVPKTEQVLGELLVRGDFRDAWSANAFSGADFREVYCPVR